MIGDVVLLICGIGVLYYGAEWLVRGAARLAASLGVSPIVVGLTVVSFGTSAPELVVCTVAALGGNPDLAIGNVMGSNLANIGLILGVTALVRPLDVRARVLWREMPLMLLVTLALYPLAWDGVLSRGDGVLLLFALVAYLIFVFYSVEDEAPEILGEYEEFKAFFHGHSYTGNQLGAAAALASLDILQGAESKKKRRVLGKLLRDELQTLWSLAAVGDVRRDGLVAGVELVLDWRTRKAFPLKAQAGIRVCEAMAQRGVLTRPIGNVIPLLPPYCTTQSQLRKMVRALRESIAEVLGGAKV